MTKKSLSLKNVLNGLEGIDLYITYRCNLRCKHCFVGEFLHKKTDFDFELHNKLIDAAKEANLNEITYLGGEPTLYKNIIEAINYTYDNGLGVRIVTNGGIGFERLMKSLPLHRLPQACLSIDGGTAEVHNAMRGKGSFEALVVNGKKYKELGGKLSAIASFDKSNYHEVTKVIELASDLGAEYLNIHYVSQRGFAREDRVLTIEQWDNVVLEVIAATKNYPIPVRFEKTFFTENEFESSCLVRSRRNIMFFPDGRVFRCSMFIDMPNSHSYTYDENGIFPNVTLTSEESICEKDSELGCPAAFSVYGATTFSAKEKSRKIGCVYGKSCASNGKIEPDFRPH